MTKCYECDGCGKHARHSTMSATVKTLLTGGGATQDYEFYELCQDCYNATKQLLKDRYNNATKGTNTGLSYYVDDEDVPVLTQEDIEDHKRKTDQKVKGKKRVNKK